MIIYEDIFSGNELISDAFNLKEVDKVLFEVDCRTITVGNDNFELEGANPSAEGGDEDAGGAGDGEQVLDIQHNFRLQKYPKLDKKLYLSYLKGYMKKIKDYLKEKGASDEEIKEFETNANTAAKKIIANYKNYDVYVGESFDGEAMQVLVDYREDGITPYATFWKHGLKELKV
ncbi:translationally-controlled tumor protein [Aspergillus arachidicola]|uniref:Translationally-controlled tumor protein homolog n=1 Tax=Aspergillus arachidicola TaxID=656916 RepID=A0A5N6XW70_9EURO|nr:translationally-controlled tumor protein [Aspergillus arachidicola]